MKNLYTQNKISWNYSFSEDNQLHIEAGHESNQLKYQLESYDWAGILEHNSYENAKNQSDDFKTILGIQLKARDEDQKFKNSALFASALWQISDKYHLKGIYRIDSKDNIEANSSKLNSWAISADWNIKSFDADNKLSYLNASMSYGKSEVFSDYLQCKENIYSDIKPESKSELNVGFQFGFFNGRINADLTYYRTNVKDVIDLAPYVGFSTNDFRFQNVGELKGNGIELGLSTLNLKGKTFTWYSNLNLSFQSNEVTKAYLTPSVLQATTGNAIIKGKSLGALYSIRFAGLNNIGLPTFHAENDEVVSSVNLQSREDVENVLKYEGPTEPKVFGGLGNTFKYKNFDLNIGLTYAFGHKIRVNSNYQPYYSDIYSFPKEMLNRWSKTGDEQNTNIPAIVNKGLYRNNSSLISEAYDNYNLSSERIAKGDFIRLNRIALSFRVPEKILSGLFMKSASISAQANNLCLLYSDSKLNGIDPEYSAVGGVSLPVPKSYTFTIKVGF